MLTDATAFVDTAWRDGMALEPQLTVSEWADAHRMLPSTSAEPGRWTTTRTPYLRGIMDELSTGSSSERVVFMKGAQVGGTEAGLNWLGYIVHHSPGLGMLVMPSLDMIRRNTRSRIDPMIEATPALSQRIAPPRARDSMNTAFSKSFPGGQIVMVGANSASGLRSTPARYLFLDEVDGYPADADGEGDPVDLAMKRTATFRGRRKILMVSTPTLKGESRIEAAFAETDQRYYHVPCPHCGTMAPLFWRNVKWPKGRRDEAHMVCEDCEGVIEERHKPVMLANGEWIATATGDGRSAGFHLSSLYSPFEPWADIALEHGRVRKDPSRLKTWVNTALGETFEDLSGENMEAAGLPERREVFGGTLPPGVVALTAGIDTQDNRLEVQIVGWGADEESWIIDHHILWGDPSAPHVWSDVDDLLQAKIPHARAVPDMAVRAACVDSGGHHTAAAYEFARKRMSRRVWAIKGRGGAGVQVWPRKPSRGKGNAPVFIVGVDGLKDRLAARLSIIEPGPGALHFSDTLDEAWFDQLTAEKMRIKYTNGRPVRTWVPKPGFARNEALDCNVYASAALHGLYASGLRLNDEAERMMDIPLKSERGARPAVEKPTGVIRSAWMDR